MTALRRRHTLMASLRGLIPADGRKTFTRRTRRSPQDMPPWRVVLPMPALWLVAEGETRIAGVTVEPGHRAVAEHRDLEWAMRQLGKFVASIATGCEQIIAATVTREEGEGYQQPVVITPQAVEFPRRGAETWSVTR